MSSRLTHYRVFIASPSGLEDERDLFYRTVQQYSEDEAQYRNVWFEPWGWEKAPSEFNDPQETIVREGLLNCDYFIMVLWDRAGTLIKKNGNEMSRTESEYRLAIELLESGLKELKGIAVFFKGIDENGKRDKDDAAQLNIAKDLRQRVMDEEVCLVKTFETAKDFERLIRQHLGIWSREHDGEGETIMNIGDGSKPVM